MCELLKQLFASGEIFSHTWVTVWLTFLSTALAYLLGLPVGILLAVTDKDGLSPNAPLKCGVGLVVNILRSMPFVILMVAFLPVAKFLVGTSSGNWAMLVMLVIAAAPYVARIVESSLKEVNGGVIEAARSMGASNFKIILKALLPEARPSLIVGAVISLVTILGYSAMASTIGGDGLGKVAIIYGHQRFHEDIIWVCVLFTVIIVQIIQEVGLYFAHKLDKRIQKIKRRKDHEKIFKSTSTKKIILTSSRWEKFTTSPSACSEKMYQKRTLKRKRRAGISSSPGTAPTAPARS